MNFCCGRIRVITFQQQIIIIAKWNSHITRKYASEMLGFNPGEKLSSSWVRKLLRFFIITYCDYLSNMAPTKPFTWVLIRYLHISTDFFRVRYVKHIRRRKVKIRPNL